MIQRTVALRANHVTLYSLVEFCRQFLGICCPHLQGERYVKHAANEHSLTQLDSETSVNFCGTTRYYIPEDRSLHNNRCENLRLKLSL
jgi:hypothetical protein